MKLDDLIDLLDFALKELASGRVVRIDPDDIDHVLWFLRLLRKREGYNVERPMRREQRREKPNPWEEVFNSSFHSTFREFNFDFSAFEEILRQQQQRANSQSDGSNQYREPPPSPEAPWWKVLGLTPQATRVQQVKAYRSLAMRYHPDRAGGDAEKMKELNRVKMELSL